MDIISKNETETIAAAQKIAAELQSGSVLLLTGPLGAGKTAFARALIRALTKSPELEVPSPTYTLVQTYDTLVAPLWHFDFYRLKDAEEIYELGWEEALDDGIIIAEWPERLGALKPRTYMDIQITPVHDQPDHRHITVKKVTA